ncbi:hypothetical protein LTR53_004387 [Teratosphaeriaceae sp. CCFEE 6253]|nr:hypothetical protein LTR53_004387 [Teratosphaeriaceae sp. CCFEE 6253]
MMQRALLHRALRLATIRRPAFRAVQPITQHLPTTRAASHASPAQFTPPAPASSNKSAVDIKIEEITELYATAQDEFEIAMEETEKMSVYAEEDRKAAREELERVQAVYTQAVEGENREIAEEVKRRVGQRIRELESGVKGMEELAMNQD